MTNREASTASVAHRIEAIQVALRTLTRYPESEPAVRRMISVLRSSAEQEGLTEIATLAQTVEQEAPAALAAGLHNLIQCMRRTLIGRNQPSLRILLVTADSALQEMLSALITTTGHQVVSCQSCASARTLMAEVMPAMVIVDTVLPDDDGRTFMADLRSHPETAAIPIVATSPAQTPDSQSPVALVHEADAYFRKPVDPAALSAFLSQRLNRGHDRHHASRRDPATGLPNRAAFKEAVTGLLEAARRNDRPVAIALIGFPEYERLEQEHSAGDRDEWIRAIAGTLSTLLRSTDILARWGLYEFAVALPGEDHFGVLCAMEKVLSRISTQSVILHGKPIELHASAGATVATASESFDECAARIEGFLFQACFAGPESGDHNIVSDTLPMPERTARMALLVNDPTMEQAITQIMERDRVDVVALRNADDLAARLQAEPFHMLIVDDHIPGADPMAIIRSLRQSPALQKVKIMLLAGAEDTISQALALGANDYILKPLAAPGFADRIRRNLSARGSRKAPAAFSVMIVDTALPQLVIAGTALYQQTGCTVLLALGLQDALTRFRDSTPDCLVVNCDIPDVALKDFLERLKSLPCFSSTPVVAASASAEAAARFPGACPNVKGRIEYPFKPSAFVAQLGSLVNLPAEAPPIRADRTPIDGEIQRLLSRSR